MRTINLIVVHCTATQGNRTLSPEALDLMHRRRGFNEQAITTTSAKTERCIYRPVERIGAHAKGFNASSIGICYEGGLDCRGRPADTRTPEQRATLRLLIHQLLEVFPGCRVCGHRDLSPDRNGNGEIEPEEWMKACPCFDAEQEFKEFAAEDTEETQSKLNYLKNKKGGK